MSDIKRGAVLLIQAGDPAISGALMDGVMAGRAARLDAEQIKTVEAEIDRQAIKQGVNRPAVQRSLLRVAVGNTKTAAEYAQLLFEAEVAYGESVYEPTRLQRALDKAMVIYAMFVEAVSSAHRGHGRGTGARKQVQ